MKVTVEISANYPHSYVHPGFTMSLVWKIYPSVHVLPHHVAAALHHLKDLNADISPTAPLMTMMIVLHNTSHMTSGTPVLCTPSTCTSP